MKKTLLYLIACALQGSRPDEQELSEVDLNKLFFAAKAHAVSAMVCMALEQTDTFRHAEESIRAKWLEQKNKAVRKNMLLDTERKSLEKEFEKNGIWYMPLKGSILKDWYPKFGMREMADNDIFFDAEKRQQVKEIFRDRGYTVESYGVSNHDAYEKPPIYNFEMHVALYHETYSEFHEKYVNIKQQLLPDSENPYRFHFTPEDFYVFAIVHAYKHYSQSGTGVRTLADIYVMNRKLAETLDREYVEKELKDLHILEYERESRKLAQKLFEKAEPVEAGDLTEDEQKMLLYYLGSGTYGTFDNMAFHRMQKMQPEGGTLTVGTKIRYLFSRMFPGLGWCRSYAPLVYRFPILLPFFWIQRLVVKGITKRHLVKQELKVIKDGGNR